MLECRAAAAGAADDTRYCVRDEVGVRFAVPRAGPFEGGEVEGADGGVFLVAGCDVCLLFVDEEYAAEEEHLAIFVAGALVMVAAGAAGGGEVGVEVGGVGDVDPLEGGDGEDVGVGEGVASEEVPAGVEGYLETGVVGSGGDGGAEGGAVGGDVTAGGDVVPD